MKPSFEEQVAQLFAKSAATVPPPEVLLEDPDSTTPATVVLNPRETEEAAAAASPARAPSGRVNARNLFQHPETHPVVLDLVLLKKYGPEFLIWETETIQLRVPKDFNTQAVSDINLQKIFACKTLHLVDTFWERWEVFCWCAMAFNGLYPNFEVMQVPTAVQAMIAIEVARRLREDIKYSDEVQAYLTNVLQHDGLFILPKNLHLHFPTPSTEDVPFDVRAVAEAVEKGSPQGLGEVEAEQYRRTQLLAEIVEQDDLQLREQLALVPHVA